jgi:hypothetical protein
MYGCCWPAMGWFIPSVFYFCIEGEKMILDYEAEYAHRVHNKLNNSI